MKPNLKYIALSFLVGVAAPALAQDVTPDSVKTRIGDAMGRVMLFDGPERFGNTHAFPGVNWHCVFLVNPVQQTDTYGQVDERLHYTYGAAYTSPGVGVMKAGPGGNYVQTFKDKDGKRFDGGKNYRLHVPANVPAAQFLSSTVYDNETRCFVDTGVAPDRSSCDDIVKNSDGSVDLYFGPEAPQGQSTTNWIKTISGKGWFTYFRLYGPTQPYFDRTWVLPDIEEMK